MSGQHCWGSEMIPPTFSNTSRAWCPFCNGEYRIRNDGVIPNHPMRYAETVAAMAAAVNYIQLDLWRDRERAARLSA